jgi:hypothetical protein
MLKKPLTILLLNDDKTASDGSKSPWCRFPASLRSNPVLRLTESDMEKVVSGLHMLENLLLGPLSPLLQPGSIHLHGEILMENRKNHGRMKGTAWMSTSKLEIMTALLMRDGRYDDAVAIVSFSLVSAIGTAFDAYKKATLVQKFKDSYLEDIGSLGSSRISGTNTDIIDTRYRYSLTRSALTYLTLDVCGPLISFSLQPPTPERARSLLGRTSQVMSPITIHTDPSG